MKYFLFADSHLNHANIATYCDRPKNFTDIIIKHWNERVTWEDTVIHLGDVAIRYALVDERDLPLEERRGWRTVLVYCLMKGALQWEDVLKEFGDPVDGFNDERWHNATESFRYGGEVISQRNIANSLE